MRRVAWVFLYFLTLGCQEIEFVLQEPRDYDIVFNENSDTSRIVMSNDVLQRAYLMANVVWTPVKRIPYRDGVYYEPGKKVKGIPYSSVKEINTYLFQDVSYHTFMTAVNNPKSVIYTEDISQEPYHGLNCAPYYGGVCSSTVMYALGFSIPYYANQIKGLSCMHKIEPQVIDSLKICDVIWKNGHVQMIFDTEYKADTLYRISIFESSGKSAHITSYSKEQFYKMWISGGYVGYRYENLKYSEDAPVFKEVKAVEYNNDLCPSKGDRAVYRTDDEIVINILTGDNEKIVLVKDDCVVSENILVRDEYVYQNLQEGIYFVYLQNGKEESQKASFEVVKTDVSCKSSDEYNLLVSFSTSAKADYVALCNIHGESTYHLISDDERNKGYVIVPRRNIQDLYCKVVFRGEYGSIINRPIRVE